MEKRKKSRKRDHKRNQKKIRKNEKKPQNIQKCAHIPHVSRERPYAKKTLNETYEGKRRKDVAKPRKMHYWSNVVSSSVGCKSAIFRTDYIYAIRAMWDAS